MKFNSFLRAFLLGFIVIFAISCDKDFNQIGADFVDSDHYNFTTQKFDVLAYNQDLRHPSQAVQTNNLPINALGYYNNPIFGKTTANFVTQLEMAAANPTFIKEIQDIVVDSVFLYVPYFGKTTGTDASGETTYALDSIYGSGKIKLEVFRSNYYLRNLELNPISGLIEPQSYFSNQQSDIESNLLSAPLNNFTDPDHRYQNEDFEFRNTSVKFYMPGSTTTIRERAAPGMYMDLSASHFKDAIFSVLGKPNLVDNNQFKNYYRGLYFKVGAHPSNPDGAALSMLNFAQGKVVIKYWDKTSADDATLVKRTMTLNMKGYTANFLETTPNPASAAYTRYDATLNSPTANGHGRLYLKGGAGSMAIIDLFGGLRNNEPDNEFTGYKNQLRIMREDKWLINEANLTFTIDDDVTYGMGTLPASDLRQEPNRVYLYDFTNKRPLLDYYFDGSTSSNPKFNKQVHSGIIQKVSSTGRGTRYKVRITNYIRSLIKNAGALKPDGTPDYAKDSVNVKLGLVVTENINSVANYRVKTPFSYLQKNPITGASETKTAKYFPAMSVMNPLGTVLYGSNIPVGDPNYDKRLQLEIIYTKPD